MKTQRKGVNSGNLSEQKFKALIENAHEGIVQYDKQGVIIYASQSVKKILGYTEAEVLGTPGVDYVHPEDAPDAAQVFKDLYNKPSNSVTRVQRLRHKKGHYILAESRLTNYAHIPEINGIVSNFRDITENKIAEEKAKKTQELLETINKNLSEAIFMGILGEGFIYVNEAFFTITGYSSIEQLKRFQPYNLFHDKEQGKDFFKALTTKTKKVEALFRSTGAKPIWGELSVNLLKNKKQSNYFVGTLRDISKEKEAELQLIESRNFLNNIINNVAAPIFVKDDKHRLVLFNDQFCSLVGKQRSEMMGKTDKDFLTPEDAAYFWKKDKEVLQTGNTIITEEKLTTREKIHQLLTIKARYVNEKGNRFIIGSVTDITFLKKAEKEIKDLHQNLEGVLESSEESIFAVDKDLCYTAFNHRHKKIMKLLYDVDIEIGTNKIKAFKNNADKKWVKAELLRALDGHHFVSDHYQDHANYKGYIQTTYNPIRGEDNEVKGVAVFVQDITHRKRYEEIIKSINANLRAIMESTSDGIVALDRSYKCLMFNYAFAASIKNIFGRGVGIGDNLLDVLPEVFEELKTRCETAFTGKQFTVETEFKPDIILETSFNPIYNDKAGVTGVALFVRDITNRKRMEQRFKLLNLELTEQNVQLAAQEEELKAALDELSKRNFELDQLMYKTSHDLRSPLSSIMGLINLANLDEDPTSCRQYLSHIEGRVKKLDEFIRSMLDYARVNRIEIEREPIDILTLANSCVTELEYLDNFRKVRVQVKATPDDGVCLSDKLRMKIIFSNIISNAYKYYNPEVKSFLKIKIVCKSNHVRLSFEDNGIGIKQEHMGKIFNMFYRATDRSQGSGLGMYIVKQAVEKLNGRIDLQSEYGKGTKIEIILPA